MEFFLLFFPLLFSYPLSCTDVALLRALRLLSLRISLCVSPHPAQVFD